MIMVMSAWIVIVLVLEMRMQLMKMRLTAHSSKIWRINMNMLALKQFWLLNFAQHVITSHQPEHFFLVVLNEKCTYGQSRLLLLMVESTHAV